MATNHWSNPGNMSRFCQDVERVCVCVNEYESSEIMMKHCAEIKRTSKELPPLHQYLCHDYADCRVLIVRGDRDLSWHSFLQSVSQGPSLKRPTELVNAVITSNSGCDLRPPVDTYAFKCEAKQWSLEVALTASCCAACAFLQRDLHLRVFIILLTYTQ